MEAVDEGEGSGGMIISGKLAEQDIRRNGMPKSQEDACALAARVDIAIHGAPSNDMERIGAAWGLAQGLFDQAFDDASEPQRWEWIDMAEQALRDAAKVKVG